MPSFPLIDPKTLFDGLPGMKWMRPFSPLVTRLLKLHHINAYYKNICTELEKEQQGEHNFFIAGLRACGINYEISEEDLSRIPQSGPLVVVANHPFGGVDGIILGALLTRARPDVKLLVNELLARVEPMNPYIFPVNVFGGKEAARGNFTSMKQALKWLQSEGCIATFPAGTVSHFSFRNMAVADPKWTDHTSSLALKTGAQVLPICFMGRNSWIFQTAGYLHPLARTAMIARELVRMKGSTVKVHIGKPISAAKLEGFDNPAELTQFLRLKTDILKDRDPRKSAGGMRRFPLVLKKKEADMAPIVPPVDAKDLHLEIASLSPESLLVVHGDFEVRIAKARDIPKTLMEIGRLREVTFRAIGEGTGSAIDLDEFDAHYLHLFIWNKANSEVVGSYRMGLTDQIVSQKGKKGLYTHTLFKLKDELLDALSPAIELGRSFIRIEYQRKQATLSLLWKGIGSFVGKNPRYARLFGPVSITAEYSSISKDLMVQFLKETKFHPTLSKMVKARNPHRTNRLRALLRESITDPGITIDDVSALISEIEADHKGVPILLKHYLKLNGVLLSFNRDPKFSNVVDGLILVDLIQSDAGTLRKHIGENAWESLQNYHKENARISTPS
jgi:putative hemolysin